MLGHSIVRDPLEGFLPCKSFFFKIFLNKNKIDSSDKLEDLHRHSLAKVKEQ
jgi:hypothetical protein